MKTEWKTTTAFLDYLNTTYAKLHTAYENNFWISYMGDHTANEKKDKALLARDAFRGNESLKETVDVFLKKSKGITKDRLALWQRFFSLYQVPSSTKELKQKIAAIETKIETLRAKREEGYVDPATKQFVKKSSNAMRSMVATQDNEAVRKACFDALQKLPLVGIPDYIKLVQLRNEFAQTLGYTDFYAYKIDIEEGMTKSELFTLWDTIYNKTKYAFEDIRALEKKEKPGLRKPWNFGYMMAGSFTKEEDPYYPFEQALSRWGRSFAALGIGFKKGTLVLDLLDRKGKYNNGFCHWPELVQFKNGKRVAGRSQFTCNVSLGIPGQSDQGYDTLFHEGGHAAHMLNTEMKDVCVNHEYPPMSTAWAETQSMFLDTVCGGIEWRTRYAKDEADRPYPFDLYERMVKSLHVTTPLGMMGIMMVCEFEKTIYEARSLTPERVIAIAKKTFKKYTDRSADSVSLLEVPHIYSWESACSYHGYGLAQLALAQWRDYFFKKYGYIVDNPHIGKEMKKVWSLGASKTFSELVKLATGKKLSATPYVQNVTRSIPSILKIAKERIETLSKKPVFKKPISLDASISMVHGKQLVATNKKSFEDMAATYATWLKKQKKK
ncbi:MAG: M3 family metallopeptidase [Minisyncoccia bacterium]